MGAAKEARDRKHFREAFDHETAQRRPIDDIAVTYENTLRRAERLAVGLETARQEITVLKQALAAETAAHSATQTRTDEQARQHYINWTRLLRNRDELLAQVAKPKILSYEAMLLPCEAGGFVLVHPAHGGMASFTSIDEAREWATRHDGYIKAQPDHHSFHGAFNRVGFNRWPVK